jgi:hypothetical protein
MSTKFYFQNVSISNFRAFDKLRIEKLKRINIIGGLNGIGKTAFLETLFFILDRRTPVALIKPLQWRRFETQSSIDPSQFLRDSSKPEAEISYATRTGKNRIALLHETIPKNVSLSMSANVPPIGFGTTETNQKGISARTYDGNDRLLEETFTMPAQNGALGNVSKTSEIPIPRGQMLSIATRGPVQEIATNLSQIIRQRRLDELLKGLRLLVPELKDIETLQDGPIAQIFADLGGKNLIPVQYLGDGFQNLFQTLIGIMNAKDGVLRD